MNPTPPMQVVSARHGWHWLRDAFAILGRNVALWMLFAFTYLVTLSVLSAVPYLGPFFFLLTTPAFTLSFAVMARESAAGRPILPVQLFAGFRGNTVPMLILGAMYAVCFMVFAWISTSIFGDALTALMRGKPRPEDSPILALIGSCALYLPVMVAFWFAPPLVGWHRMSAPKAVFFSLFAALSNWRAMLWYGLALLAMWGLAAALLAFMVRMFGPEIGANGMSIDSMRSILTLVMIVATPLGLAGFALQLITYYTSYRDVFADEAIASTGSARSPAE